jgi:hypothetical protein
MSNIIPTSSALWDDTIDSNAITEQAKVWAASSKSNFGLNYDQNMDAKKIRQYVIWFDVFHGLGKTLLLVPQIQYFKIIYFIYAIISIHLIYEHSLVLVIELLTVVLMEIWDI